MAQISTIAINKKNDIYLDGSNNIAMKNDIHAVADVVLNKARTNLGELQFNKDIGIPYFSLIFTSNPNLNLWEKFMEDSALSIEGVTDINSFQYEVNGNILTYQMTIKTQFGSMTING